MRTKLAPIMGRKKAGPGVKCQVMKDLHSAGILFSVRVCGQIPQPGEHWLDHLQTYKNTVLGAMPPAEIVELMVLDWYPSIMEITQASAARWCV